MKAKDEWKKIKDMLESGKTSEEVAKLYGVTRQRIGQIRKKYFPEVDRKDMGIELIAKKKRQKKIESWGRDSWILDDLSRAQHLKFVRKRQNVRQTGHEWNLNLEDVQWNSHCPILGIELDYFAESTQENSPSFDRTDASKGYVRGNVIIVSWRANRIKNNGTAEEHRRIAEYLDSL
jgi:hypothetical protein